MRLISTAICFTLAALSFSAASMIFPDQANAEVIYKQTFQYFTVRGDTSRQVFRDFQRRSPIKSEGQSHAALGVAAISFDRQIRYKKTDRSCKVDSAKITADVTIHLPKWANYNSVDRSRRQSWDNFVEVIRKHELEHGAIAKKHAERIQRKIVSFRSRGDCETLEAAIIQASTRLLAKHDREQQRFDRREYRRLFR